MHPNEQLIEWFCTAVGAKDYASIQACDAMQITFEDEVFNLKGKEAGAVWHRLCSSGSDLQVTHRDVHADDTAGRTHLEACYNFASTGREDLNLIDAEYQFQAGHITAHRDHFSFWRWSSQALGPPGCFWAGPHSCAIKCAVWLAPGWTNLSRPLPLINSAARPAPVSTRLI
jgi:hypothetical protein